MIYTSDNRIEEFMQEYKRSRIIIETTVRAILKKAVEYEEVFNKPFYQFTKVEILQMFKAIRNRSVRALMNGVLVLEHASKWILHQNNEPLSNEYETITKDDLYGCVDVDTIDKMMISREQLTMMQNELLNYTDRAILELLFLGATGKWMSELTYLVPDQVSRKDMCIYFRTGKIIPIEKRTYDILQMAFAERETISYSAIAKISKVQGEGIYKMRSNTLYDNANIKDDNDIERRARWLQRRIIVAAEYLDVPMTPKSLSASGFWHYSHVEMDSLGIDDFRHYIGTEQGRHLAARYGFRSKHYVSILLDKYRQYL